MEVQQGSAGTPAFRITSFSIVSLGKSLGLSPVDGPTQAVTSLPARISSFPETARPQDLVGKALQGTSHPHRLRKTKYGCAPHPLFLFLALLNGACTSRSLRNGFETRLPSPTADGRASPPPTPQLKLNRPEAPAPPPRAGPLPDRAAALPQRGRGRVGRLPAEGSGAAAAAAAARCGAGPASGTT